MTRPAFRRAFSSLGCVDYSLPDILRLAARHRLDAVELRGLDGSLDVADALARALGSPDRATSRPAGDVSICALDTSLRLSDHVPADREELIRLAPWADALGAPRLRVFDGARALEPDGLALTLDTLAWWRSVRHARSWKVDLMVETHSSLLRTPDILGFLAKAPSETRLLWDSHHTWRIGGEPPAETWSALRSRVAHIHVKDSVATPGEKHDYRHVLCGEGEFPMRDLREALASDSYGGIVSLEWERRWHPEMPPLEQALSSADSRSWW